ncbi:MAG: hypothetical protein AAFR53_16370 [Pseudomonadota bacterium]
MIVVFFMAATIWAIGVAMKTPRQARLIMIGLLFLGVLAIHIILPDGHPLREGTGGSAALWLLHWRRAAGWPFSTRAGSATSA